MATHLLPLVADTVPGVPRCSAPSRQLPLAAFGDPSIRLTRGANTFTLQNLACHSRFRQESDAVYRAAVLDR